MSPVSLLREATKQFPLLKYAWAVVGIVAVIAIIGGLNLSSVNVPAISILTILGVMVLIFVFAIIATRNTDPFIRIPFLALIYTIVFGVCISVIILGIFVFTGHPSHLNNFFKIGKVNIESSENSQTETDDSATIERRYNERSGAFPKIKPNLNIPDTKQYRLRFEEAKGSELSLSRLGEEAFKQGDYEWSKNFFKQCKFVQASKVWMSNYPYFAGSYLMIGQKDSAIMILDEMYNQVGVPNTYLSHEQPIGFLLSALNETRSKVDPQYQPILDKYFNLVSNK